LSKIKWFDLLRRLKSHSDLINKSLNSAINEAKNLKSSIELEMKNSELLFQSIQKDINNNQQNSLSEEFDEPDALVLQEDEDLDGDDFSSIGDKHQVNKNRTVLEKKYREIENLTKNSLILDSIQSEIKAGRCFKEFILKVSPNFLQGNT